MGGSLRKTWGRDAAGIQHADVEAGEIRNLENSGKIAVANPLWRRSSRRSSRSSSRKSDLAVPLSDLRAVSLHTGGSGNTPVCSGRLRAAAVDSPSSGQRRRRNFAGQNVSYAPSRLSGGEDRGTYEARLDAIVEARKYVNGQHFFLFHHFVPVHHSVLPDFQLFLCSRHPMHGFKTCDVAEQRREMRGEAALDSSSTGQRRRRKFASHRGYAASRLSGGEDRGAKAEAGQQRR